MHAMVNIQIRNVPEETHAVLRRRARERGMSLQEYLLGLVNEAASRPTPEEFWAAFRPPPSSTATTDQIVDDIRAIRDAR